MLLMILLFLKRPFLFFSPLVKLGLSGLYLAGTITAVKTQWYWYVINFKYYFLLNILVAIKIWHWGWQQVKFNSFECIDESLLTSCLQSASLVYNFR